MIETSTKTPPILYGGEAPADGSADTPGTSSQSSPVASVQQSWAGTVWDDLMAIPKDAENAATNVADSMSTTAIAVAVGVVALCATVAAIYFLRR